MANTKTASKAKQTKPKAETPVKPIAAVEATPVAEEAPVYHVRRQIDPNTVIPVRSGFSGVLVYKSRRTGERFVWQGYGDILDMEYSELKIAKSSNKAFFANNWWFIDDPEIMDSLGVAQYYKTALDDEEFFALLKKDPSEIEAYIATLNKGQKTTFIYKVKMLMQEDRIDSVKVISTLEKCLGIELMER